MKPLKDEAFEDEWANEYCKAGMWPPGLQTLLGTCRNGVACWKEAPYHKMMVSFGKAASIGLQKAFFFGGHWPRYLNFIQFHSISASGSGLSKMLITPETALVIRTPTIKIAFCLFIPSFSVYSATFPSATSFVDAELASSIAQIKWLVHCTPYTSSSCFDIFVLDRFS